MAAAISSVCGIFTTAIVAIVILVIVLAIAGMIFVYAGLDNGNFEKEDVTEWLKIIFRQKIIKVDLGSRAIYIKMPY